MIETEQSDREFNPCEKPSAPPGQASIWALVKGLSRTSSGPDYFKSLARELTAALGVEYAFVAEVVRGDPLRARTVAVFADGAFVEGFEYDLDGTPCRELIDLPFCCYPEGVRHCFPEDPLFVEWRIEGYAGVRFVDGSGAIIGWVGVMSGTPFRDTSLIRSAMNVVAERTSAELQRDLNARALRNANEELENRVLLRTKELERSNTRLREEIAERRWYERKLVESRERYALAARGSNDGLWDWNIESGALVVSERWKEIVGWNNSDVDPSWDDWLAAIHVEDRDEVNGLLERHWRGERELYEVEHRIVVSQSNERWVLCRGAVRRNADGEVTRFAGSLTDITRRKQHEQRVVFEATHDRLTGLANRTALLDRLEHALALNTREQLYEFALLVIDIDRFKIVNESLGHQSGDELLCEIGRRISRSTRPADLLARLGGDEFAVLVENVSGPHDATSLADRILESLSTPIQLAGEEVSPAATIGIALSSRSNGTAIEMIRDADTAMNRAKEKGRGRFAIFDPRMHLEAVRRLQIEADIRRALERDELRLAYQPIIEPCTGELDGFEVLVRWQHPTRGLLMPCDFIPVAEDTGLITGIGEWVITAACQQLRDWRAELATRVKLNVNVSIRELQDPAFVPRIDAALCRHGLSGGGIRLELTESVMMENHQEALVIFDQLRALGLELCIDDFGTGYSSLSNLARIPIDILKIDRSFVSDVDRNAQSEELVSMIIGLAHNLNLRVVAEGVETIGQLEKLVALNCDHVQGYLLSTPKDAMVAGEMLRNGTGFQQFTAARQARSAAKPEALL